MFKIRNLAGRYCRPWELTNAELRVTWHEDHMADSTPAWVPAGSFDGATTGIRYRRGLAAAPLITWHMRRIFQPQI